MVLVTVDQHLVKYVNGLADRGAFDSVHCAPNSPADIPDEAGGVRAVVLGIKHVHASGRDASDAMSEAKDILLQRGSAPRVYRNTLLFIAADARQLDNLKQAVRFSLAWASIVAETDRLDLTQSDAARARPSTRIFQSARLMYLEAATGSQELNKLMQMFARHPVW